MWQYSESTTNFLTLVSMSVVLLQETVSWILTYLLTHSMEQSCSWEANWFSASQEIARILRNPKVRYRIRKSPPPLPILSQIYCATVQTFVARDFCITVMVNWHRQQCQPTDMWTAYRHVNSLQAREQPTDMRTAYRHVKSLQTCEEPTSTRTAYRHAISLQIW